MFSDTLTIFLKDLKLDLRTKENLVSMLFFSVIILLVFGFAVPAEEETQRLLAPGIFWVTFLLSGFLGLNKNFQVEKEGNCMEALLLTPVSRGSIFLGKMSGNIVFIMILQTLLLPLVSLLFDSTFLSCYGQLLGINLLAAIGFSSLGTLLAGITTDIRFKEILLPILLFPLVVPLLMACVTITQSILGGQGFLGEADWLKLLLGFDGIFLIISYLTFEFVMEI